MTHDIVTIYHTFYNNSDDDLHAISLRDDYLAFQYVRLIVVSIYSLTQYSELSRLQSVLTCDMPM